MGRHFESSAVTQVLTRLGGAATWIWSVVIAADFFFLSNPLAFFPFETSLDLSVLLTLGALLATTKRPPRLITSWPLLTVLAFLTLIWLSIGWSVNPDRTLGEAVRFTIIACLAIAIASAVSTRVIAQGVTFGTTAVLAASLITYVAGLPGTVPRPGQPFALIGIGTNPNILAYCMVLGLGFALAYFPARWLGRFTWAICILLILTGAYLSQSRTGHLAACIVVLLAILAIPTCGPRRLALVFRGILAIALMALILISATLPALVKWIWPDGSMQVGDRLPIWSSAVFAGNRRPFTGFGWSTVWTHPWEPPYLPDANTSMLKLMREHSGIPATHGHSSFFDLLPQLGYPGAILFCATIMVGVLSGLRLLKLPGAKGSDAHVVGRLVLTGSVAVLMCGLTEPIASLPLGWFLIVTMACSAGNNGPPARQLHRSFSRSC